MFNGDTYTADHDINAAGTSLQGHIVASREDLMKVFGSPIDYPLGDKVTTEWIIEFNDLEIATIYDWKNEVRPNFNEIFEWNIGGKTYDVVSRIKEIVSRSQFDVIA